MLTKCTAEQQTQIKCCLFSMFITDHYVGVRSRFYKHLSAGPFRDRLHVLRNEV